MVFGLDESVELCRWKSNIDLSMAEVCDSVFIPEPVGLGKGRFIIVRCFDVLTLSVLEMDHSSPSQCKHGVIQDSHCCQTNCLRCCLFGQETGI